MLQTLTPNLTEHTLDQYDTCSQVELSPCLMHMSKQFTSCCVSIAVCMTGLGADIVQYVAHHWFPHHLSQLTVPRHIGWLMGRGALRTITEAWAR